MFERPARVVRRRKLRLIEQILQVWIIRSLLLRQIRRHGQIVYVITSERVAATLAAAARRLIVALVARHLAVRSAHLVVPLG